MYGIDFVILCSEQIRKMSIAYSNVVRCYFALSRFSSERNLLYFLGSMPFKEFLSCNGILRLLVYLSTDHTNFNALRLKYDVHCNMSIGLIKSAFMRVLLFNLKIDNLVQHQFIFCFVTLLCLAAFLMRIKIVIIIIVVVVVAERGRNIFSALPPV